MLCLRYLAWLCWLNITTWLSEIENNENKQTKNQKNKEDWFWKNVFNLGGGVFAGFWLTSCWCVACFFVWFHFNFDVFVFLSLSVFPVAKQPPPHTRNNKIQLETRCFYGCWLCCFVLGGCLLQPQQNPQKWTRQQTKNRRKGKG